MLLMKNLRNIQQNILKYLKVSVKYIINQSQLMDIFIVIIIMRGALGPGKQVIIKRQFQRNFQKHQNRVRQVRPLTIGWQSSNQPIINQQKKHRLLEDKITQIERENRSLLEKITKTAKKSFKRQGDQQKMNKSLNYPFRKRKIQQIDSENFKLLKRLQEKKSNYNTAKLKQQWKKQKQVIKNIANFPFVLKDGSKRFRKKSFSRNQMRYSLDIDKQLEAKNFQLLRMKTFDGVSMAISVKLNKNNLLIMSNQKSSNDLKVIEIPRDQGLLFIEKQCQNKPQNLIDHLHYDKQSGILQLRSTRGRHLSQAPEMIPQEEFIPDGIQSH